MYSKNKLQYFQKENYIELKTLEYYFGGDNKLANNLFDLRHKLNPIGFEKYIKFRLKKLGYKMKNYTGGNKADGGIDLKGEYKNIPIYIQCKKYIKNSTHKGLSRLSDVRSFYGGVVDENKGNISDKKIFLVFITTGSFTQDARKFAKRNNIKLLDYKDVAKMTLEYPLEDFYNDIGNVDNIINETFNKQTSLINYTFDELLPKDILEYLKNIRSYIVSETLKLPENSTGYETFEDKTLKEMAKLRIHNFQGLKTFYKHCKNDFEKRHIDDFQIELLNGFKILENNSL